MILEVIRNGEVVDRANVAQFTPATSITIQTPTGPNTYRIYPDRTEWIISPPAWEVVRVHVVTE